MSRWTEYKSTIAVAALLASLLAIGVASELSKSSQKLTAAITAATR